LVGNRINKIAIENVTANRRRGGDVRAVLTPVTVNATSGFMGTVTIEPGEFVSEHYHPYSEEFLLVIHGTIEVSLDGVPVNVNAGESLLIPIDVRHRLLNTGTATAFAVFHLSPLAPRPDAGHVDTEPYPETASTAAGEAR